MNEVTLRGGVTKDAEISNVGVNGVPCVEFTLAVNGTRFDPEANEQVIKSVFVICQAWHEVAQRLIDDYGGLHRGDEVLVLGEVDQQRRSGKEDQRPSTRYIALRVDVLRSPHMVSMRQGIGSQEARPF
jgi:single-stranded DNA-binding protein